MKAIEWIAIFALLMLVAVSFAAAEDTLISNQSGNSTTLEATVDSDVDTEADTGAGVTPDSPWYGLDNAWDNVGLAFTFNKEKRAEKALQIARERLYEVKKMIEEGKLDQAEKARLRYDKLISKSKESIDQLESDGNSEKARAALERIIMMQNNAEAHFDRLTAVKEKILARLGDNITEEQKARLDAFFAKLENKSLEVEQRLEQKKENVITKYKVLSNKTDDEVENETEHIENEAGLWDGRRERARNELLRTRLAVLKAKEKIKESSDDQSEEEVELETELEDAEDDLDDLNNETHFREKYKEARESAMLIREYGNEIAAIATTLGDAKRNGTWNETKAQLRAAIETRKEVRDDLLRQRLELRERIESTDSSRYGLKMRLEEREEILRQKIDIRIQERREKMERGGGSSPDDSDDEVESDDSGNDGEGDTNDDSGSGDTNDDGEGNGGNSSGSGSG